MLLANHNKATTPCIIQSLSLPHPMLVILCVCVIFYVEKGDKSTTLHSKHLIDVVQTFRLTVNLILLK